LFVGSVRMRMIVMAVTAGSVMVVRVSVDYIRGWRRATAVRHLAARHLKLNRRVVDAEVIAQLVIHVVQQRLTFAYSHLAYLHVAGQRVALRGQTPDVEIMYVDHPGNALYR